MKRFQFLLLDAGPIIKLFSLGIWDEFVKRCDVTISRIIADHQALYTEDGCEQINLKPYEEQNLIRIIDIDVPCIDRFYREFKLEGKYDIHTGEQETLAFMCTSSENWMACSSDQVVFRILGRLNKGDQGISLQEILAATGLGSGLNWEDLKPAAGDWKYTKEFREKWTHRGQQDFVQDWSPA